MDADLDTLATALYARADDLLKAFPERAPWRPGTGIAPKISGSGLAGYAEYGYCASHSRYFWGLRLHLLTTLHGLPIGFALTGAKADERQVLLSILAADPDLAALLPGQIIIGDKNYYGADFEAVLTSTGASLLRPARKGEPERPGSQFFKPLRQIIESVNDTFKGQLDLERHGGHTPAGVITRVQQRILALTAAIWHNDHTGQPVMRSLIAYDHCLPLGIGHLVLSICRDRAIAAWVRMTAATATAVITRTGVLIADSCGKTGANCRPGDLAWPGW